jgi:hypothetical protein
VLLYFHWAIRVINSFITAIRGRIRLTVAPLSSPRQAEGPSIRARQRDVIVRSLSTTIDDSILREFDPSRPRARLLSESTGVRFFSPLTESLSLSLSLFRSSPPPPSPSPRATPLCLPVGETVSHRAAGERETLFSRKLSNAVRPRQSNQQLWKYAMGLETMVIINAGRLRRAMEHAHRCIDISWMIIAQTIMIISFQSSRGN